MLLTNDGSIVNNLLQKENATEKDYEVTVNKPLTASFIEQMSQGVEIYNPRIKEHSLTNKCKVVRLSDDRFMITLSQGLNRQIRRMCRRFQYTVIELKRVRMKHLTLDGLEKGEWRYLTEEEIIGLK